MYNEEGSRTSHNDGNGMWYVNIRDSKGYRKEIVPANEIYELKREYHTSKSNPTFELVEGLWLTDTTYTNEALIDLKGKNPEFPGPSFWHFRKTRECYRRFAGEIVIMKPELLKIKKIGHDLDKALSQGLCDVFNEAKRLWCTQHMQKRDVHKLKTLGCTQRSQSRVMSDIYGTQDAEWFGRRRGRMRF